MASEPPAKKMKAVVRDAQHCKRLVLSLQSFNAQNNFTDLCFVCARGHKVYAHKLLLCTVSSLLKQIFLDIPDTLQMITIHLPDVESRLLNLMFDFLYEGSVRINKNEYNDFQKVMDMLGIVLTTPNKEPVTNTATATLSQPPPAQPPPAQQQIQPSQLVYLQTPPNSQGQVQYVLAAPASLAQGSMVGMSPVVSAQTSTQSLMMTPNTGQMMQAGSQVQQNNMMQIVQPSGGQVMPVVQCAGQMVVQGNQQTIMASNQVQVGMQNQTVSVAQSNYPTQSTQQQPQYAMSSSTNQMTTPTRQFNQPNSTTRINQSTVGRAKTVQQQPQPRVTNSNEISTEDIMLVLQEHTDLDSLTAKAIRECLEAKLNVDLSGREKQIDQVLKACQTLDESILPDNPSIAEPDAPSSVPKANLRPRKKKSIPFSKSDDEQDEDFKPWHQAKKKRGRKKK